MKTLLKLFLILSILFLPISLQAETENEIVIHYFMEYTCPNCAEVTEILDEYLEDKDHITLMKYDIILDRDKEALFLELVDVFDRSRATVPYIVIGGRDLQGLYEIESELIPTIEYYENQDDYVRIVDKVMNDELVLDSDFYVEDIEGRTVNLPIIGEIELASFSLFLGAVFIGLIDGFNPCAMWILIFLITLLINLKDRKKIWILGLTFILTSGLVYYIIMMSWLQLVIKVAMIQAFQIAIGILALIFSVFSLKHFWHQHRIDTGCEVTNTKQKRRLMDRAKKIVNSKNIWIAMVGIAGLAVSVNIIELACSAGLPVIYSSMLAYHQVTSVQSALYILVYVIFFIFDDLLIFTIAIITLKVTGISNKYAKYSNLLGGLIMLFIGIALIFFPQILL
jgi:thiol-disulfide isomerase/thioredoxin